MFAFNLSPGNLQALVLSVFLLGMIICLYIARINDQRPNGFCLFLFRVMHFSFGLLFIMMGFLSFLKNADMISIVHYIVVFAFLFAGLSVVLWNGKNCGSNNV